MAHKKQIPIIGTFHSQYKADFTKYVKSDFIVDMLLKYIVDFYNSVDHVWAVSKGAAEVLRGYGCTQDIEVMYNGTDFRYPDDPERRIKWVNEKYGIAPDERILLFVGRLVSQKNIFMMADGLKLLRDTGKKFRVMIAGIGPDEQAFKDKITALGMDDIVIYTGAISERNDLASIFLRADLFIFPSIYDTSGLVKIEAAAQRTASLLVENTCAAEEVVDGVNGFICKNDAQSFADRIKSVLDDTAMLKRVAENAYQTLYLSWDMIVRQTEKKYQEAIDEYNKKHSLPVRR